MFSPQGVPGLVMVEGRDFPGIFIMAIGAFFSEGGPVGVGVAIGAAGESKSRPFFRLVAFFAFYFQVRAFQREPAFPVIEGHLFERGVQAVAFIAGRSQFAVVGILVAGGAPGVFNQVRSRFLFPRGIEGGMAAVAVGDFPVEPRKGVTRFRVVEFFCIPEDQLKFFAVMFRVAGGTLFFFVAVKAFVSVYPFGQVFVAVEAFCRVCLFPCRMAFDAVFYPREFRVYFAEFSR